MVIGRRSVGGHRGAVARGHVLRAGDRGAFEGRRADSRLPSTPAASRPSRGKSPSRSRRHRGSARCPSSRPDAHREPASCAALTGSTAGGAGSGPTSRSRRDGTAIVVWSRVVRGHFRIFAAVRRKGRGFGPGREIGRTDKQFGAVPRSRVRLLRGTHSWSGAGATGCSMSSALAATASVRARTIRVGRASLHVPIEEKHFAFDRQRNAYLVLASSGKRRRASGGDSGDRGAGWHLPLASVSGARRSSARPAATSPAGEPASHPRVAAGAPGEEIVAWRGSPTPTLRNIPARCWPPSLRTAVAGAAPDAHRAGYVRGARTVALGRRPAGRGNGRLGRSSRRPGTSPGR